MKIHEYQAKSIFRKHNIPVPSGEIAHTAQEACQIASRLETYPVVLKAQIHAGGRGKGGGVKLAHTPEDVEKFAQELVGMTLVTKQTGPKGRKVNKILIEAGVAIEQELYLSFTHNRSTATIAIIASAAGGMDIEEVATTTPDKITTIHINPLLGLQKNQCHKIAAGIHLPDEHYGGFTGLLADLYTVFIQYDCTLLEINPLVITPDGMLALDAKIEVDDNALFRQPEIRDFKDPQEEDELELQAAQYNLNYIKLDGNVGNMVNGAGLAMATMDLIQQAGAEPANFLDVGGGASAEMVEKGFEIILQDDNVRGILINIFGGILRCDVLAQGVVEAAKKISINVPVIVRMEGTNVSEGKEILAQSGLNLITADSLKDAAGKVAALVAS